MSNSRIGPTPPIERREVENVNGVFRFSVQLPEMFWVYGSTHSSTWHSLIGPTT